MRSRFSRYDTIVVGGRVAGAATAMLLAQRGQRVLVLERGTYGSDTLSTHALMRGGVVQLDRWGVLGDIVDAGTPPVNATTFHYPDESVVVDLKQPLYALAADRPRRRPRRCSLGRRCRRAVLDACEPTRDRPRRARHRRRRDRRGWPPVLGPRRSRRRRRWNQLTRRSCRRRARRTDWLLRDGFDLRLLVGHRRDRLRVGVRLRRRGRVHPDQRRTDMRVRRPHPDAVRGGARERPRRVPRRCWRESHSSRIGSPPRIPGAPRAASPACAVTCARPPGRAGRSSATPDTSRTRRPHTASPTRCAMPNCSPARSSATRSPTTRPNATGSRRNCSRSPTRSRRSSGTSTSCASSCSR